MRKHNQSRPVTQPGGFCVGPLAPEGMVLAFTVPKGHKATLQAAADAQGESLNAYVNKAVLARLGLEEWPEGEGR